MNRRTFLNAAVATSTLGAEMLSDSPAVGERDFDAPTHYFKTRGVVLRVHDDLISLPRDWPRWAKNAGLTTIGTHITPSSVLDFVRSEPGHVFLNECKSHGLHVEHELHAMKDLLPRELFEKDRSMFRMNELGERVADYNCCVHSDRAIQVICENAVQYAATLKPTTGRYFYWLDDNSPVCACPQCREYSPSEQALIVENAMVKALKKIDCGATLAHLAYLATMPPPLKVKPETDLFLEFAPIRRSFNSPLRDRKAKGNNPRLGVVPHGKILDYLDANLEVFPRQTAQVLEYWIDVSMFSKWKRPSVKLPWHPEILKADIATYSKRGIRHITCFANFVDRDYIVRFGHPDFVDEYGRMLETYKLD